MIRSSKLICDNCKIAIKSTRSMTTEDWIRQESATPVLCIKCEAPIRLEELELAWKLGDMRSDHYWSRKKELEQIISNL